MQRGNRVIEKLLIGADSILAGVLSGTGSAVVTVKAPDGRIEIDCTALQAGETLTIPTPFPFEIIDMKTIHGNATLCTVQALNKTDPVTDALAIAATDKVIDRAATIDDAVSSFETGDDDLVIAVVTAAFTGKIIIEVVIPN